MSMGGPPDVDAILSSQKQLRAFLDECVKSIPSTSRKLALLGFSRAVLWHTVCVQIPALAALAVLE